MTHTSQEHHYTENVQEHLKEVELLLNKHATLEQVDTAVNKQHRAELRRKLDSLHPADIAFILEALPIEQRLLVWDLVKSERNGEILIDVSDAVRESLIATMNREELSAAAEQLDTDEIADLAPDLPQNVMRDVFKSLSIEERERLRAAISYAKDSVGALMDFNMIHIRCDISLEVVSRYLRRFDELIDHHDQLFVVDFNNRFIGVLPLNRILVYEPEVIVSKVMITDILQLHPEEKAEHAAQAFERYHLASAPVVDEDGKLVGRVTVNEVLKYIRAESKSEALHLVGLRVEEDIFASVWKSAQNRWLWLALNLCAAFFVSRVISSFEGTIASLVALATLMPIVALIAGNAASQTAAIIIRSLALGRISLDNARGVLQKELTLGALNGLVWGGATGLFTYFMYHSVSLGIVMTAAILLNMLVGAVTGLAIPLIMHRLGRDAAIGSGVIITAITYSGGFSIFLGLATIFLV